MACRSRRCTSARTRGSYFVAPVVSWQLGDRTKITFSGKYQVRPKKFCQSGLPAEGTILTLPMAD
ncbi:MAG: hypothetical protein V7K48_27390 [Nostoc sp.]|uniref:hypothetical protein n=1 Tax=Nostoc sp. TaxID=1180 RepID=UPI002FFB6A92